MFVLSKHLTPENADELLREARGKSRRELERLVARLFPRSDVEERIAPIAGLGTGSVVASPDAGAGADEFRGRVEPLSALRYRVEFTASGEFCGKVERARELLSHSLPSGELATLFERALDELIAREVRRREGRGVPRKRRELKAGSRHVPVEVARAVWQRDGACCAFTNAEGRRCTERRFLTLEHRVPFARGGAPTIENVCLLCASHNGYTAREAFGQAFMEQKRADRKQAQQQRAEGKTGPRPERAGNVYERAMSALTRLGFRRSQVVRALEAAVGDAQDVAAVVRAALVKLTPQSPCM